VLGTGRRSGTKREVLQCGLLGGLQWGTYALPFALHSFLTIAWINMTRKEKGVAMHLKQRKNGAKEQAPAQLGSELRRDIFREPVWSLVDLASDATLGNDAKLAE
jgi:hypothetical protein